MAAKSRAKTDANPVSSAAANLSNAVRINGADSPEAVSARVELTTVQIEVYIRRLVDQAPPLPEENRRRIKAVLDSAVAA